MLGLRSWRETCVSVGEITRGAESDMGGGRRWTWSCVSGEPGEGGMLHATRM